MSKETQDPLLPHKQDPALLESYRYINSMPGKNVRGKMIDSFQIWMNVESSEVLDSIKVSENSQVRIVI
jgi:geranylgeranyl diphosphate synthase type 3